MIATPMARLWARTALIWFLLTMSFGMYLGMTGQFGFSSPHAHMGLLGWLSSAVFGFFYSVADADLSLKRGPRIHWISHNLGVVIMVSALFLTLKTGDESFSKFIATGGGIVILSTLYLTTMIWPRLGSRVA
jgi:hypothetical protein